MTTPIERLDITSLPYRFRHPATPRRDVELDALAVITVHVTDARGGFDVVPYQIAHATYLLRRGEVPSELAHLDAPELARALRYANEPYHRLGCRVLGSVRLHPLRLRTPHGGAGNIGPGWALDCHHAEQLTPRLRDVGVASLLDLIEDVAELRRTRTAAAREGHDAPPLRKVVIVPHRAWSPDRRVDPDPIVWGGVVIPVLQTRRTDDVEVVAGYNTCADGGRPIPRSWDPAALYDDKGRRIA